MKSLMIAMTLASAIAVAETGTFTVKGMHCSGCKDTVTKKVCEGEAAKDAESCTVTITNAKKELGEVVIVTKPGVKINEAAVTAGVKAAGDEYKVTQVKIKEMIAQDMKADANTAAAAAGATPETVTTTTTVETKSHDHATGKPVVKTEKTKKIVKKMAKKDQGATTAPAAAPATGATPAAPTAPTTPETK